LDPPGCQANELAKLLPDDGSPEDRFGGRVSIFGDTAVFGVPIDDDQGPYSGSAYVFDKVSGVWTQSAKLLPAGGTAYDFFGISIAIFGDTVVVGADGDDDSGSSSGSAYVFENVGGVWTQTAKLLAADGATADHFGFSVSVSGDTAVIGAHHDDDNGMDSGSVYVFEKVSGVWTQIGKLLGADGAAGDLFGLDRRRQARHRR
jgi:hypothetical protein